MNDQTNRELLEELLDKVEDNRVMLKGLRNRMRWMSIMGVVKWVIYIGIAVGLYTYLLPFVEQIGNVYGSLKESLGTIEEIKGTVSSIQVPNVLDLFKSGE